MNTLQAKLEDLRAEWALSDKIINQIHSLHTATDTELSDAIDQIIVIRTRMLSEIHRIEQQLDNE